MENKILNVPLIKLKIHPELEKINPNRNYQTKYKVLRASIHKYGILEPLKVVRVDENDTRVGISHDYDIVDGIGRYIMSLPLNENIEKIPVQIISPVESDAIIDSLIRNIKVKKTYWEIAIAAKYYLDKIGNSQGKKRENIDEEKKNAAGDRYDLTCAELNLGFSGKTLRRLMKIYDYSIDYRNENLLTKLDNGESINKLYKKTLEPEEERRNREMEREKILKERKILKELEENDKIEESYDKGYLEGYAAANRELFDPKNKLNCEVLPTSNNRTIYRIKGLKFDISDEDELKIQEILKKYKKL